MLRKKGHVSTLKCQPRKEIPGKLIMKQRWFSSAELCVLNCTFMWFLGQFATFLPHFITFLQQQKEKEGPQWPIYYGTNNAWGSGSPSLGVRFNHGYFIFLLSKRNLRVHSQEFDCSSQGLHLRVSFFKCCQQHCVHLHLLSMLHATSLFMWMPCLPLPEHLSNPLITKMEKLRARDVTWLAFPYVDHQDWGIKWLLR